MMVNICLSIDTRSDTTTNRSNNSPNLLPTLDGGFYVFWVAQSGYYDIYAQKFSKAHSKIGGEILIANTYAANTFKVQVIRLANNKIVVLYHILVNGFKIWALKFLDENLTFTINQTNFGPTSNVSGNDLCLFGSNKIAIFQNFINMPYGDQDCAVDIIDENSKYIGGLALATSRSPQGDAGQSCLQLSNGNMFLIYNSIGQDGSG